MKTKKSKRTPPRRRRRRLSGGRLLRFSPFQEAYYDALYALELQEIERWLTNPRTRELLTRHSKELLEEFLRQANA
jgi:hypothetical protein